MSPAPRVSPAQAVAIAERYYGVSGRAERQEAAVDDVFRLVTPHGAGRLRKIGMPDGRPAPGLEPASLQPASFQTAVMLHLAAAAPDLPVQRVVTALDVVAGYHAADPLSDADLELAADFIVGRVVTRIIVSRWNAAREPSNRGYLLRRTPLAIEQLAALRQVSPEVIADRLRAVRK